MRIENDTVARSQTLDRGLAVLQVLADTDQPQSTDDLAVLLGLHRSVVYRLVRTLEDRRLVERNAAGRFIPGLGLAALARSVRTPLRSAAAPVLAAIADDLQMTAFLVVRDGDEAVTIDSVEPRGSTVHVAYRPGTRHAIDRGAPGLALLAGERPRVGERHQVTACRAAGWVQTTAEVLPGMSAIAAPILDIAAIAVVHLAGHPVSDRGPAVVAAAARAIADRLAGSPV